MEFDWGEAEGTAGLEQTSRVQVLLVAFQIPDEMMVFWCIATLLALIWLCSILRYWGVIDPPFRALQIMSKRSVLETRQLKPGLSKRSSEDEREYLP